VYVIAAKPKGPVKIGYAKEPRKRLGELQIGNHEVLDIMWDWGNLTRDEAIELEAQTHEALKAKKIRGEWFNAGLNEAVEAMKVDTKAQASRILQRYGISYGSW
jgi:predicted GIY-YIG superfamily endonuclease